MTQVGLPGRPRQTAHLDRAARMPTCQNSPLKPQGNQVTAVPPPGRSSTVASPTSRRLSSTECRAWLGKRSQGRLGHLTGRGPRSTVVGYTVTDDQVVFRLPEYNEICQYAPGH